VNDTLCAVSLLLANDVALVNYATGKILGRVQVGTSPEGLIVAAGKIWVANSGFDFGSYAFGPGTVSVVNPVTRTVVATIPVGTNPQALAPSSDGLVHVVCTGNYADRTGIVYVLSPQTQAVVDSLPLGGAPGDLVIGQDGIAYLAAGGWTDFGQIFRYNSLTHAVLNNLANPWRSARGVTAVLPRLEGGIYALCFEADSVIEHRADGAIARGWQVGDGPQSAVSITNPNPGDLNEDGSLDVFDVIAIIGAAFSGADDLYWGCVQ
jgi:YVTN family beta-propeller protein